MNFYKVHNLPALHPEVKLHFPYILEGQYLVASKHALYTELPTEHDIHICMAMQGYLCMLNQALYPLNVSKDYECSLYPFLWKRKNNDWELSFLNFPMTLNHLNKRISKIAKISMEYLSKCSVNCPNSLIFQLRRLLSLFESILDRTGIAETK